MSVIRHKKCASIMQIYVENHLFSAGCVKKHLGVARKYLLTQESCSAAAFTPPEVHNSQKRLNVSEVG